MLWSAHWKKSSQFAWIGRKQPLQGPRVFPEAGTKAQMSVVLCLGGTGKAEWHVESDSKSAFLLVPTVMSQENIVSAGSGGNGAAQT